MPSDDDTSQANGGLGRAETRLLGDRSLESLVEAEEGEGAKDEGEISSPCTLHYDGDSGALTPTEPDNEL